MEFKQRIVRILTMIFMMLFLSFREKEIMDCRVENDIKVCISKIRDKKKKETFVVITYSNIKGRRMDSIYYSSPLVFQFYAKDSIVGVTETFDTLKTFSYVFEDRFDNMLPSYKQIVGFKETKSKINQLIIKNCGINQSFNINN